MKDSLFQVNKDIDACKTCEICKYSMRKTHHTGSNVPWVLFIGEANDSSDNIRGEPFSGRAGRILKREIGIMEDEDGLEVAFTLAVKCMPTLLELKHDPGQAGKRYVRKSRPPEPREINACAKFLARQIYLMKPRIVVTLGLVARKAMDRVESKYGTASMQYRRFALMNPIAAASDLELNKKWQKQFDELYVNIIKDTSDFRQKEWL